VPLERLTEIAVQVAVHGGHELELPLQTNAGAASQLASVSMLVTVAAVTAIGVWLLNLPLGAAVLLGAIWRSTDPVLASEGRVANGDRDSLGLA
jgi:NhaP-type Na+/H+ or K+/H+ antiporter